MSTTISDRRPGRFALLGWAFLFIFFTVAAIVLFTVEVYSAALLWVGLFIPVFFGMTGLVRSFANWHRWWAGRMLGEEIRRPYLPRREGSWSTRLRDTIADPATWRDVLWLLVSATLGLTTFCVVVSFFAAGLLYLVYPLLWAVTPRGVFDDLWGFIHISSLGAAFITYPVAALSFGLWWRTTPALMRCYARVSRSLLAPTERSLLRQRVSQLAESRADTVDTQAAELRRIERDLHDGAQARLVSLGMSLGLADDIVDRDPAAAKELLAEARASTTQALAELRDLVRGIHPPVLADRGLDGAVRALCLACPLPTDVEIDLPGRLPAPVESAAYFAVAENITNVIKHAGASKAWVQLKYDAGTLSMLVSDDGHGGADTDGGTGLRGIERRLAAFDGTLVVTSPPGGPTVVVMELPCELLSAKTSPSSETA
ncbi:MAG TPA: sensor domain-containing protein [Mycobacteriales bacterium]|jgi:signal transduction histidine kinase|nr:sensor domain-containing protein [Mycobacteriales bacterium]